MTSSNQQHLMLSDALDRVAANPTASHLWLNLTQLMRGISSAELLARVVDAIAALVPDHGLAGFYRAAALDLATGDPALLPQACACLRSIAPPDLDRCTAFFDLTWQRALIYADGRAAFRQRLKDIGLPELSLLIGRQLAHHQQAQARPPAVAPATKPALRRVALIAPHLASPAHPPTLMALDQARTLIQFGIEVNLFSCQESLVPDAAHLLGTSAGNPQLRTDLQPWLDAVDAPVRVHLADPRLSLRRRWLGMLEQIDAFAPDLVLFVGLHSGLVPALYQRFPVLGLSTNSIAPIVPTDAWLTAQATLADKVSRPWSEAFPDTMACHHPFRVRRKAVGAALPRDSLGLEDDALLLISIGAHLQLKIDGEWAQRMCAAMERHPKLVWILLGGEGKLPPALAGLAPGRLRLYKHTPQAMQWLAASDLYIHPPIMGGGFSVAEAMSLGIPALALADSDGGDKAGGHAVASLDDYFAQLDALAGDAALRRTWGQQMRNHFDTMLDLAASGPSLLAACQTAMQRYRQRITAPGA
ncbi:hypothetical protein ACEN9F_13870 [Duganella sp. CT11-25]|uniref:hypothetical protein n=1 Tax=unclassified Duganella TaxID=2636909 RepID=UPI0039B01155